MNAQKEYTIRLNGLELGQMIDGLETRSRAWRDTANYLETGEMPSSDFVAEECSDVDEALRLAEHYDRIIALVVKQKQQQD